MAKEVRRCLCGCKVEVTKRSTFALGHPAKLRGKVLRVEKLTKAQASYVKKAWGGAKKMRDAKGRGWGK